MSFRPRGAKEFGPRRHLLRADVGDEYVILCSVPFRFSIFLQRLLTTGESQSSNRNNLRSEAVRFRWNWFHTESRSRGRIQSFS